MLKIVTVPDPVLRKKALPITKIDEKIRQLMAELQDTLENNPRKGIGLSAPQVSQSLRLVLAKDGREQGARTYVLINPEIASQSTEKEDAYEGCLSIPDTYCLITRHKKVVVKALNGEGKKVTIKAADLFARVLQHEIDHLNGLLITDKALGKVLNEAEFDKLTGD